MASDTVCIASLDCRITEPKTDGLSHIRLHLVVDYAKLVAELAGSWIQFALDQGLLDCTGSQTKAGRDTRSAALHKGFRPLQFASEPITSEMFYFLLVSETFSQEHISQPIRLRPCADHLPPLALQPVLLSWSSSACRQVEDLESALRMATSSAAMVFQMSYIPDVGKEQLQQAGEWLRRRGIDAARRALVLHYRAGRLPAMWSERLTTSTFRAHVGSTAGRAGLPHEGFWNNWWAMLLLQARAEHGESLCAGRQPQPCNRTVAIERWCVAQRLAPAPVPSAVRPSGEPSQEIVRSSELSGDSAPLDGCAYACSCERSESFADRC